MAKSVDPDQTPQNAASDQSLLCLPSMKHGDNKKKTTIPYIGNGPVRKVKVEEFIALNTGFSLWQDNKQPDIPSIGKKAGQKT